MQRWGALQISWLVLGACNSSGANVDATTCTSGCDGQHPSDGRPTDGVMADVPGGVGEPPELTGITLFHNQARAMVDTTGIAAGPLPSLSWDASLAATASAWVAMCQDTNGDGLIDHNPNRSTGHPYYVGENVYGSSGAASAQQAVTLWVGEKANYDYATNTCNGVCGHYTQVVWRDTLYLGCAVGNCPGQTYGHSIVCDYGPGGNINGQRPY